MKKLIVFLTLTWITSGFSQVYTASDGTKVTVTSFDGNADNLRKFNFRLGIFYSDIDINSLNNLGLSYYSANKFFISSTFGINSVSIDANIFLKSKIKEKMISQSLKSTSIKMYVAQLPVSRKIYHAPHIGASLGRLGEHQDPFLYSQFFCGFSIVKVVHAQLKTENVSVRGGRLTRMNFDLVGCTPYGPNELIQLEAYNYRRVGVRVYLDGQIGTWSEKGRVSFHYAIGVSYTKGFKYISSKGSTFKGVNSINPIIELGVGWCFW